MTNEQEMKPSEILAGAIELLDGGENWIRDELWDGDQGYCLLGAVSKSYYGSRFCEIWGESFDRLYPKTAIDPVLNKTNDFIVKATGGLEGYVVNDDPDTEFEEVREVLCCAVKLALEAEGLEDAAQCHVQPSEEVANHGTN